MKNPDITTGTNPDAPRALSMQDYELRARKLRAEAMSDMLAAIGRGIASLAAKAFPRATPPLGVLPVAS